MRNLLTWLVLVAGTVLLLLLSGIWYLCPGSITKTTRKPHPQDHPEDRQCDHWALGLAGVYVGPSLLPSCRHGFTGSSSQKRQNFNSVGKWREVEGGNAWCYKVWCPHQADAIGSMCTFPVVPLAAMAPPSVVRARGACVTRAPAARSPRPRQREEQGGSGSGSGRRWKRRRRQHSAYEI